MPGANFDLTGTVPGGVREGNAMKLAFVGMRRPRVALSRSRRNGQGLGQDGARTGSATG